ncbi:hypothetical protein EG329_006383 [Mollisiaceae sp. DMI_Dod_QoI]|nr:hypothetical protein EG329_006383 [Helotiales sp. DMI_Dod_QoI]
MNGCQEPSSSSAENICRPSTKISDEAWLIYDCHCTKEAELRCQLEENAREVTVVYEQEFHVLEVAGTLEALDVSSSQDLMDEARTAVKQMIELVGPDSLKKIATEALGDLPTTPTSSHSAEQAVDNIHIPAHLILAFRKHLPKEAAKIADWTVDSVVAMLKDTQTNTRQIEQRLADSQVDIPDSQVQSQWTQAISPARANLLQARPKPKGDLNYALSKPNVSSPLAAPKRRRMNSPPNQPTSDEGGINFQHLLNEHSQCQSNIEQANLRNATLEAECTSLRAQFLHNYYLRTRPSQSLVTEYESSIQNEVPIADLTPMQHRQTLPLRFADDFCDAPMKPANCYSVGYLYSIAQDYDENLDDDMLLPADSLSLQHILWMSSRVPQIIRTKDPYQIQLLIQYVEQMIIHLPHRCVQQPIVVHMVSMIMQMVVIDYHESPWMPLHLSLQDAIDFEDTTIRHQK